MTNNGTSFFQKIESHLKNIVDKCDSPSVKQEVEEIYLDLERTKRLFNWYQFTHHESLLGYWEYNIQTKEVWYDQNWLNLLGIFEPVASQTIEIWDKRLHPDDREQAYLDVKRCIDRKIVNYESCHRLKHESGSWIWILDRGRISHWDSDGQPLKFSGFSLDITNLKDSQHLSERLQKMAKIGSWEMDSADKKFVWSQQAFNIWGLEESVPVDLMYAAEFLIEGQRSDFVQVIESCILGKSFKMPFELVNKTGEKKYIEVTGEPIYNSSDRVVKVLGTIQDITELKQAENRLEEAQAIANIGSWHFDLKTKNQEWSKEHYRIFEIPYPQDSKNLYDLYISRIHPDDRSRLSILQHRAVANAEDFVFDHRVYLDSGARIKHVRGLGKVLKDAKGVPIGISGTCQDITQVVTLIEQRQFVLDSMGIGIWQYNPITQDLVWDKSMYAVFEIDEQDFSGHYQAWEKSLTPAAKDKAVQDLVMALKGEKDFNTTFEIRTKNGTLKHIGGRAIVVRNNEGDPLMMYGINWDRTKEVMLEKGLEQERLKSIHSAKLASLGQMSAGIAHEINNPLAIVLSGTRWMARLQRDPEEFTKKSDGVIKAAERIEKIVKGLKKFSRSTDFTCRDNVSVKHIVSEALVLTEHLFAKFKTKLIISEVPDTKIVCDSVEIEQVVINLLNNALDAVKHSANAWVQINVFVKETNLVIQVVDSGKGIPKEVAEKIFNPFFTTKSPGEGTGLGLSISSGIIADHGGTLRLDDSREHTTFEISFPLNLSFS